MCVGEVASAGCGLELRCLPSPRTVPSARNQRTLICTKTINNAAAAGAAGAGGEGKGRGALAKGRWGSWCERRYKRQSYKKQPPKQSLSLPLPLPLHSAHLFISLSLSRCLCLSLWRPALNPTDNIYCKCSNKFQNTIR